MHILLAIDGSRESLNAASFLARLPFAEKPRVTLVSALVEPSFDFPVGAQSAELREAEEAAAKEGYKSAESVLAPAGFELEHIIECGHPSRVILHAAESRAVDLMTLGAHGHSAIYRVLLGSTADFVANHAKSSVLIVRSQPADSGEATANNSFNVLIAYDGSARSKLAYEQCAQFMWSAEAKLHIRMLLARPALLPEDVVYDAETISQTTAVLADLAHRAHEYSMTYSVQETVHIGSALRVEATRRNSTLLFLGDTGKSAIARFFLGSTSRYLLHHAPCSLWIARRKEWH